MATIVAQEIVDRAKLILKDNNVRWDDRDELLVWLSEGQRETVLFKPDAYVKNEAAQLVAGTKQSIPTGGIQLFNVPRNMGAAGTTPGKAIRQATFDVMNSFDLDWHSATASATVENFIFDERDPKRFYVSPPQPNSGMGYVEIVYAAIPPEVSDITGVITLDDIYAPVLCNYILHKAYAKEIDLHPGEKAKSDKYYGYFINALGGKEASEDKYAP